MFYPYEEVQIVGLLKVMRDVTAQKRAEEGLREAIRRKNELLRPCWLTSSVAYASQRFTNSFTKGFYKCPGYVCVRKDDG